MTNGKTNTPVKSGRLKIIKEGVKTCKAKMDNGEQAAEQELGGKTRGT